MEIYRGKEVRNALNIARADEGNLHDVVDLKWIKYSLQWIISEAVTKNYKGVLGYYARLKNKIENNSA